MHILFGIPVIDSPGRESASLTVMDSFGVQAAAAKTAIAMDRCDFIDIPGFAAMTDRSPQCMA
jgi:hypothetical protein